MDFGLLPIFLLFLFHAMHSSSQEIKAPGPCGNFKVTQEYMSPVALLTWSRPAVTNGPIDGYEYKCDKSQTDSVVSDEAVVTVECPVVEDKFYVFLVRAFNNYNTTATARSNFTHATFRSNPGVPKRPEGLKTITITQSSIWISWGIISGFMPHGFLINCDGCGSKEEINTTSYYYTFEGLEPRTNITVRVKGYNMAINNENRLIIGPEATLEATTTAKSGVSVQFSTSTLLICIQLLATMKSLNSY